MPFNIYIAINHYSTRIKIKKGTPQGGILSPDLFNRYTNSLMYSINAPLSTYTNADDLWARNHKKTKLLITIEQLQQET